MDPFVRKLVQRLLDPDKPLSRNRHFHTFQSEEGRTALKITRRLRSLRKDIEACSAQGQVPRLVPQETPPGWRLELELKDVQGLRSTFLAEAELALLRTLPGMAALLPSARD